MSRYLLLLSAALVLVLLPGTANASDAPVWLDAGPQSPTAACDEPQIDAAALSFTPIGNGAVWTHHDGCHAQITCESNCVFSCAGQSVCTVGSNYVECDGQRKYCPTCDLQQYPGFPACGLRQCPWCVCVSNGGSSQECCSL